MNYALSLSFVIFTHLILFFFILCSRYTFVNSVEFMLAYGNCLRKCFVLSFNDRPVCCFSVCSLIIQSIWCCFKNRIPYLCLPLKLWCGIIPFSGCLSRWMNGRLLIRFLSNLVLMIFDKLYWETLKTDDNTLLDKKAYRPGAVATHPNFSFNRSSIYCSLSFFIDCVIFVNILILLCLDC